MPDDSLLIAEDASKLHAAINQIDNQRMVLTTLAITIVASAAGIALGQRGEVVGDVRLVIISSIALLVALLMLFVYSQYLKRMLRTFTTYLCVQRLSRWEIDRGRFRRRYSENLEWHERGPATIYIVLGAAVTAYPIALLSLYPATQLHIGWLVAEGVAAGAYAVVVVGMGLWGWGDSEGDTEAKWRDLLPQQIESA